MQDGGCKGPGGEEERRGKERTGQEKRGGKEERREERRKERQKAERKDAPADSGMLMDMKLGTSGLPEAYPASPDFRFLYFLFLVFIILYFILLFLRWIL